MNSRMQYIPTDTTLRAIRPAATSAFGVLGPCLAAMLTLTTIGCKHLDAFLDDRPPAMPDVPGGNIPALHLGEYEKGHEVSVEQEVGEGAREEAPAEVSLSLAECRALALSGNLALQVEQLSPAIAAEALTEAEAAFEAAVYSDVGYSTTDTPTSSTLTGSHVETITATPGVRLPLRTGGQVQVEAPLTSAETNNVFSTLNPAYPTDLRASIQQPLLRGGGRPVAMSPIHIAEVSRRRSHAMLRLEVTRVLGAVDRVYWQLLASRRELTVREQELQLAEEQLGKAKRMVEAGTKPEVEILRASLGVAERREAIILAGTRVRERERDLKRIVQKPGMDMASRTIVLPVTLPSVAPCRPDPECLIELSLKNRMDLLELELQSVQEALTSLLQKNRTRPLVSLGYTYNVNGLGDDWGDAFDLLFEKRFEDHQLGLRVEIPLGNEAALSRWRQSLLKRARLLAQREQRESIVRQEIYAATDRLGASWQRVVAGRERVTHAARLAEAEAHQFELGLRTSTDVLEAQARLANARSAEIAAIVEYQIAQVDLAVATGCLLAADHIRIQE